VKALDVFIAIDNINASIRSQPESSVGVGHDDAAAK
jgi:hypothetical protein